MRYIIRAVGSACAIVSLLATNCAAFNFGSIVSKATNAASKAASAVASAAPDVANVLKSGAGAAMGLVDSALSSPTAARLANAAAEAIRPVATQVLSTVGDAAGTAAAQAIGALGQRAGQATLGTGGGAAGQGGEAAGTEEAIALSAALQNWDIDLLRLTRYADLTNQALTDNHVVALVEWIGVLDTNGVEGITLDLGGNQITAQGIAMLTEALRQHPGVVNVLGLTGNPLGDDGAVHVAAIIGVLPIRAVVLDTANISEMGAQTVIEAIGAAGDGVMLYASMEGNRVQGGSPQLAQTIAAIQQGGGAPDGIHI